MQRAQERRQLRCTLKLFRTGTGAPAGSVVDIHTDGLMLEAEQPFDADFLYCLDMPLPEPLQGLEQLRLGLDCVWARPADHFRAYWGGFRIIDASPRTLAALSELIDRYQR